MLIALSLSLLTLQGATPSRKPAAGPAPFALEGVWVGEEVGSIGSKQPTITFTRDGGTLAYEDATGGTGSFTLRLQALKVEGTQVHFAVPGGGKLRHWSGRWDGQKITGTIAADAGGAPQVGTFVLRRPVYEEAPRRAADSPSHSAGASDSASSPGPSSDSSSNAAAAGAPDSASSGGEGERAASKESPSTSGGDRQREEGAKRLKQRLRVVSELASQLLLSVVVWQDACRSGGTPRSDWSAVDCDRHIYSMGQMGLAASKGLDQAEDEARRAGVDPGTVRQLRADHGLDSSKWDELFSKKRQAEEEWARRKR